MNTDVLGLNYAPAFGLELPSSAIRPASFSFRVCHGAIQVLDAALSKFRCCTKASFNAV